jgi:hypothetical protein
VSFTEARYKVDLSTQDDGPVLKNKGITKGSNGDANAGAFPRHLILNVRMVLEEIKPEENSCRHARRQKAGGSGSGKLTHHRLVNLRSRS